MKLSLLVKDGLIDLNIERYLGINDAPGGSCGEAPVEGNKCWPEIHPAQTLVSGRNPEV